MCPHAVPDPLNPSPPSPLLSRTCVRAGATQTGLHHDLITLIFTTSPTPSAPSTELLSEVIHSFQKHCPSLTACRVILVIDTFDRVSSQNRLKKGTVTADGATKFAEYKQNAKNLIINEYSRRFDKDEANNELTVAEGEAEYGSDVYAQQTNAVPLTITKTRNGLVTFIEPDQRLGFGLAVRSALRLTETPYVWVQQHDWSLVSDIPLTPLLDIMRKTEADPSSHPDPLTGLVSNISVPVKYICFPSTRMLSYATSDHVVQFPALKALTNLYKQSFSLHSPETDTSVKIPLTPMFFWFDKPHIASTGHYLNHVFPNRLAMMRGAFIEDTVGHRARTEMKNGEWIKWACWLYYPDEGKKLVLRHLKGRTWRGTDGEEEQILEWKRLNALKQHRKHKKL
ncbi:hypothetical protein QBC37DRAFT_193233 [Rhypophila decipiens]|uniref:Uncharacterized protein n=1 Tax=Rhypophila decipiens TaxID=261697 RepID=A0AAN7B714_9PEZI|nr:hypothetical protein QBC37DRAFT_193233 [Rhypophila decipiens]